ncbi:MAG: hypothetical protein L6Q81_03820 [Bacteroidia bacterium]|nr:hypothetical protein [Bacteroidia bacterium]
MKQVHPEIHRLTTLQKQILRWIRLEGGGCLPVPRLFNSLYNTQSQAYPDATSLCQRMAEAVEQLCRSGHAEVRYAGSDKVKFPSLYDLGGIDRNLEFTEEGFWIWKTTDVPEVALTDFGSHYAAMYS